MPHHGRRGQTPACTGQRGGLGGRVRCARRCGRSAALQTAPLFNAGYIVETPAANALQQMIDNLDNGQHVVLSLATMNRPGLPVCLQPAHPAHPGRVGEAHQRFPERQIGFNRAAAAGDRGGGSAQAP